MSTPAGGDATPHNIDTRPARQRPKGVKRTNPKTGLLALAAIFLIFIVSLASAGTWKPKMGLDLEGGRMVVLEPVVPGGKSINESQVKQAVDIIRNRVDATGTSEAEVSTLGSKNIVVSIPGNPSQQVLDSLSRSSQLNFRPVISSAKGTSQGVSPYKLPQVIKGSSSGSASPSSSAAAKPSATPSAASPSSGATSKSSSAAAKSSSKDVFPSAFTQAGPTNGSDPSWAQEKVDSVWVKAGVASPGTTYGELLNLYGCTPAYQQIASQTPNNEPTVMCSKEGDEKLLLGPVEVKGKDLSDASSGLAPNQQGNTTGETEVTLKLNDEGKKAFSNVTTRLARLQDPQNRFAITVDGQSISAPRVQEPLTRGEAQITGGFTPQSGKLLADSLKFGALPMSFVEQTSDQQSPELGSDQLTKGLIAGAIGMALVVLYSLFQYRALGLVTVASLVTAAALSYLAVVGLGQMNNFRLSMAGVTGLIV